MSFISVDNAFAWGDGIKGHHSLIWRDSGLAVELDVSGIVVDCFLGPVSKETKCVHIYTHFALNLNNITIT